MRWRIGALIVLTAGIMLETAAAAPALSLDTSFDGDGISSIDLSDPDEQVVDAVVFPDGSALTLVRAFDGWSIVKLAPGGEIDRTFASAGVAAAPQLEVRGGEWQRVNVDPSGHVYVSGWRGVSPPPLISSHAEPIVARFDADGARDTEFGIASIRMPETKYQFARDQAIDDGRIYITGTRQPQSGDFDIFVSCLVLETGAPCQDFGANGSTKVSFTTGRYEEGDSIAVDSAGRPVVGATVSNEDGASFPAVLRFLPNGELDGSFAGDGTRVLEHSGYNARVAVAPDDSVVVAREGEEELWVSRFSSSGVDDARFGTAEIKPPLFDFPTGFGIVAGSDRVFVGLQDGPPAASTQVAAIQAAGPGAGDLDPGFGNQGFLEPHTADDSAVNAAWLGSASDGNLYIGGAVGPASLDTDAALIAVDPNGDLAPSRKDTTAPLRRDSNPTDLIRVKNGYRVLAEPRIGRNTPTAVAAFDLDGSLDQVFAPADNNLLGSKGDWDIAQLIADPQGRALVSERITDDERSLARLADTGEVDSDFGDAGREEVAGRVYASKGQVFAERLGTLARLSQRAHFEPLTAYTYGCEQRLDLDVDSAGNLLELCNGAGSGNTFVRKLNSSGRVVNSFGNQGRKLLRAPGVFSTIELEPIRRGGFVVASESELQPDQLQFERYSSRAKVRSLFLVPDLLGGRSYLSDGWLAKDGRDGFYALVGSRPEGSGSTLLRLNRNATRVGDTFQLENSTDASGLTVGEEGISFAAELSSGSAAIVRLTR